MAESIIKYSELIEDDGGFERTKEDLKKLGDSLISEAKRIKKEIGVIDPKNIDLLSEYQEAVEALKQTNKTHKKTLEVVHRAENERSKARKESIQLQKLQDKSITELELRYKKLRSELKRVNKREKEGNITAEEAAELQAKLNVELKSVRSERNKVQKEIVESNKLSKKEQKLQDALITIESERKENLSEIRERMSALRLVVQNTNLTTEEGRQKIAAYNQEINELTDVLEKNSDKFIQNKINVGNYKDSIVEALEETDIFSTGISQLDVILNKLSGSIIRMAKSQDENADATRKNTRETKKLRRAFRMLGKTLKATGIILLITALVSLFAMFRQGRSGVVKTEKAMATLQNTVKVLISVFGDLGSALVGLFGAIYDSLKNLDERAERTFLKLQKRLLGIIPGGVGVEDKINSITNRISELDKKIAENSGNTEKYFDKIANIITGAEDRINDAADSIDESFEAIVRGFEIDDEIRKTTLELIKLKSELRSLEIQSGDSTLSLRTQIESTRLALTKNLEVLAKENEILQLNLEKANAKARADLLANRTSIGARAESLAMIKDETEFAKQLLQLNIDLSERNGENPLDNTTLQESQQALQEYLTGLEEVKHVQEENAKQRREIERDLFEQNLDLLIDLIDREKDLSEQYVNDISKNYKSRVREFERFILKFGENAKTELDEFNKYAKKTGKDAEFSIDYNDDGSFKVFLNDQELAIENIVELKEQLQSSDFGENPINRFREFVQELQAAKRDFIDLQKSMSEVAVKISELRGTQIIEAEELNKIEKLNRELARISKVNINSLSPSEKTKLFEQIEEIENEKNRIQQQAERKRIQNRIKSINRELKVVEFGSEKEIELMNERIQLQKDLANLDFDFNTNNLKGGLEEMKGVWQQFGDELKSIMNEVFRQIEQSQQNAVNRSSEQLDRQQDAVQDQRKRAQQGLENTLAFEQKQLAKREQKMQEEQKRLEQIQKLKAYWNTYNANLQSLNEGQDSNQAIVKTLRDMAIMEGITASLASFGEGGLAEDKVPTNGMGITRGRSHKGQQGGIPVMIEGNEGFFSGKEVSNLGKSNFYAIKELAGRGKLDSDYFTRQRQDFVTTMPVPSNKNLERELKEVKKAIENKPVSNFDVLKLSNGMLELVETTSTKNKKIRNHYRIKKPKL